MGRASTNRQPIVWDPERGVYLLADGQPLLSRREVSRWALTWAWLKDQAFNLGLALAAVAILVAFSLVRGGGQ